MRCVDGEELTTCFRLGDLFKLFPPSWKPPSSLLEALQQADIPNAKEVVASCEEIAESVSSSIAKGSGACDCVSKEDVAVIACYSFDFGSGDYDYESVSKRSVLVYIMFLFSL